VSIRGRRHWRVAAALALVAGALLLGWLLTHDRTSSSGEAPDGEQTGGGAGREALLRGSSAPSALAVNPTGTPESPAEAAVVRVIDAVAGDPVGDASVELIDGVDSDVWPGWARRRSSLGRGITDGSGTLRIEFPAPAPEGATRFVIVEHESHIAAVEPLAATSDTVVALSRGMAVSGRVVRAGTDRPIPHVPVVLTAADLPPDSAGCVVATGRPGALTTTSSDAEGAFRFTVPEGRYLLRAGNETWTLKRPRRQDALNIRGNALPVEAGDSNVVLEMDAFRVVRFELVEAGTGRRVTSVPTGVHAFDLDPNIPANGEGSLLSAVSIYRQGRWDRLGEGDAERSIYAGMVPVALEDGEVPETIGIMLRVPRYRAARGDVRLLTLDAVESGALDSIVLTPEEGGGDATLLLDLHAPYEGRYVTRIVPLVHTWDVDGKGYSTHRAVPRQAHWVIEGLPRRQLRIVVDDGVQLSEERIVDLSAGVEHELRVDMPPATGFVLGVRTRSGESVPRVTVWARSDAGREMRIPDFTRRWSLDRRLGIPCPFVHRVEPGRYALSVFADGSGWWEGDVTVAPGQVAVVEGRLEEPVR